MATTFVQAGRRYVFTAVANLTAGDLTYYEGYFGVVQDDVAICEKGVLILEGVWDLKNVYGGPFIPGSIVYAAPTVYPSGYATSIRLYMPATGLSSVPSGAHPVGRTWNATVAASAATAVARVKLFSDAAYIKQG